MKTHVNVMRLALLFGVVGMALRLLAVTNLLVNADFASEDGRVPDGWSALRGAHRQAYVTKNGELAIRGVTATYANYVGQEVPIRDNRSYYFEAEVMSEALSGPASVVYSVKRGKKKIVADQPIFKGFTGPLRKWTKFSAVIPVPVGEGADGLSVSFILYNPSRRPGSTAAIRFRNPVLCEYAGQKVQPLPEARAEEKATMPDNPFAHNFTREPIGTVYRLERGGVGFLRVDSGTMPRAPVTMRVDVPATVETELYISRRGNRGRLERIVPNASGAYEIGPEYDWLTWGNTLLFRAGAETPEKFSIRMSFEALGKKAAYEVPVGIIGTRQAVRLPQAFRYNAWQAFPVTRIDTEDPENRLGRALSEYWLETGWRNTRVVEINWAVPWRVPPVIKGAHADCRVALDANGAPQRSWCDSAQIELGEGYFRRLLAGGGLEKRLKESDFAMWDYEPYCEGAVTASCFCEHCRRAFAAEQGLADVPSARDILAKMQPEWIRFRCSQRAKVVATAVRAVKSINPSIRFLFCSMPGDPGTDPDWYRKYGIDLPLYNGIVDIFATMNYSSSLDYFRSLENEKAVLNRESRMFISNGWGNPDEYPKLRANQLLAAFFAGIDYPFVGQGLFVSQGDFIAALRGVMSFVAEAEGQWRDAAYNADKLPLANGFRGEGNVYSLERKAADGTRHVLIFNNSKEDTAYAKLSVPDEDALTVELKPLTYRYLVLDAAGRAERARRSAEDAARESAAIAAYEGQFAKRTAHGMTTDATPDQFKVVTPAQALTFDLRDCGAGAWYVGGKRRGLTVGRDYLATGEIFALQKGCPGVVEKSEILDDAVALTLAYRIPKAPFDGLTVRRHYRIFRDKPEFDVDLEVVPDGGYRPFRLRTGVNFQLTSSAAPTDVISEYATGASTERGTKHVAFVRSDAKFPGGHPFFVGRHVKDPGTLTEPACRLREIASGAEFEVRAATPVDEVFGWRDPNSASVELIFPDAYERNDPHAVKTWRTSYSVKSNQPKKEQGGVK